MYRLGRQSKNKETNKHLRKEIKRRAKKRKENLDGLEEIYPGPTEESLLYTPVGVLSCTLPWR